MSIWRSRYLQLNLNNEIKCQYFQGTFIFKKMGLACFDSQNICGILAKWTFVNISTEHHSLKPSSEPSLRVASDSLKDKMAVVKQNISKEASFSPRRGCFPLALLWNPAGWGSLWYNDSAVILSILVGGKGDGMDTRLINFLTHLWRRGILCRRCLIYPAKSRIN